MGSGPLYVGEYLPGKQLPGDEIEDPKGFPFITLSEEYMATAVG